MEDKYAEILDSTTLNSTIIWNLLLESEDTGEILHNRKNIKSEGLFEESWLTEADADILAIYSIYSDEYMGYTLYRYDDKERNSFVTVYKNKQNKYYISIKHVVYTELEDWGGPNLKWNKNT